MIAIHIIIIEIDGRIKIINSEGEERDPTQLERATYSELEPELRRLLAVQP